ncbi:ABC transporter permease subunit, partial [Dactylosporangium sp. NPDC050588]|uniref:ABC transporter permease subunit n=1 Tax=Dactylosporangium sp. NPDC050588 TaxID=3157211 RepID=UPI0034103F47
MRRAPRVVPRPSARPPWLRTQFGWVDWVVAAAVLVLFYLVFRIAEGTTVSFTPQHLAIDTNPARLPYYAGRSLLRMFVALGVSTVFTFGYAYAAARSRRLEKILIPALDILQSVPVLAFLTVAIGALLALFPHSFIGLELASITIAGAMAIPTDLREAMDNLGVHRWRRWRRLIIPAIFPYYVTGGITASGGAWNAS